MHVRRMLVVGMILIVAGPVAAAPEFRVSAVGGNGCGFWGPGFSAVDSRPVLDVQSFFDSIHPATYRYTASSSCGELRLHTEIDWACNCGTLCGENNGLSQLTLDDVVVTGPPGATTANFRINLDLAVPTDTSVGQINWRLYAFAVAFNQALIDTGDHLGTLPTTRFVSSLGSWPVNVPFTLFVRVTTSIHAVDQTPAARGEAIVELIADGVHVSPEVVAMVFDLVGPDRVALVSDAMAATGLGDGRYRIGALPVDVRAGTARLVGPDGTLGPIAGSTHTLADCVAWAVGVAGIALADARRAASITPARAIALSLG